MRTDDKLKSEVRVRMAPSPTGNLHLGTAYSTLFNYLFAKRNKGTFILRLEDTDLQRSKSGFEENIINGLRWLGLSWDEYYRQSERLDNYKQVAQKLLDQGNAYFCFCTPEELDVERYALQEKGLPQVYSRKCRNLDVASWEKLLKEGRSHVLRFKMPEDRGKIKFNDLLHGNIEFDSRLIGDTVIMRGNQMPLYNFAVVVDDIDMKITHVLRGDDHISNTPKQIVLFEALGAKLPEFAHWPMVLNPDRIGKLSKRQGATSIDEYRKIGYLPEAMLNYFSLLGWTMPDDREIMSLKEMEQSFDLTKMRLSGAAFNQDKLDWLNGEYIRQLSDEELTRRLQEFLVDHPAKEGVAPVVPLISERIKKLSDFISLTYFLYQEPDYDLSVFESLKLEDQTKTLLEEIAQRLKVLVLPWTAEQFEKTFRDLSETNKIPAAKIFQLIRVSISGQLVTPPLFETIQILGEATTLKRVKFVATTYPKF